MSFSYSIQISSHWNDGKHSAKFPDSSFFLYLIALSSSSQWSWFLRSTGFSIAVMCFLLYPFGSTWTDGVSEPQKLCIVENKKKLKHFASCRHQTKTIIKLDIGFVASSSSFISLNKFISPVLGVFWLQTIPITVWGQQEQATKR